MKSIIEFFKNDTVNALLCFAFIFLSSFGCGIQTKVMFDKYVFDKPLAYVKHSSKPVIIKHCIIKDSTLDVSIEKVSPLYYEVKCFKNKEMQ